MEMEDENDDSIKPEKKSFVSRLKYFENNISSSNEDLSKKRYSVTPTKNRQFKQNRLSYHDSSSLSSIQDVENRPIKPADLKSGMVPDNCVRSTQKLPGSSTNVSTPPVPIRRNKPQLLCNTDKHVSSSRSWSLRKKTPTLQTLYQHKSLFNISNLDRSMPNTPLNRDISQSRTLSMTKTGSVLSLFDDDAHSTIVDYSIDWKAIFEKISEKTSNDIDNELINYFHNSRIDLKLFPTNCLHWFLTFDDVLAIVCNDVLPSDSLVDFEQEILKIPTQIVYTDYDLNTHEVSKLIKGNIKNLEQMVVDYNDRKKKLGESLEQLKESLERYLIRRDLMGKVCREIDNICTKFQLLSDVLILIITTMSTWKLLKDFPQLNEHKQDGLSTLKFCENTLSDFRDSQKKLEQQIMKLFRQFSEENYNEVLQLFDQLFSENLEVSICLPIFEDKLRKDNQMLVIVESSNTVVKGEEQFV